MSDTLEVTCLSPSEIDDQAVAEIAALLSADSCYALQPSSLLRMAATGPLLVARRRSGLSPEIVGLAGLAPRGKGERLEVVVVNPDLASTSLACELLDGLRGEAPGPSLFRRRDRAPLGWSAFAAGA
jgi:hypothetical protein